MPTWWPWAWSTPSWRRRVRVGWSPTNSAMVSLLVAGVASEGGQVLESPFEHLLVVDVLQVHDRGASVAAGDLCRGHQRPARWPAGPSEPQLEPRRRSGACAHRPQGFLDLIDVSFVDQLEDAGSGHCVRN